MAGFQKHMGRLPERKYFMTVIPKLFSKHMITAMGFVAPIMLNAIIIHTMLWLQATHDRLADWQSITIFIIVLAIMFAIQILGMKIAQRICDNQNSSSDAISDDRLSKTHGRLPKGDML